MEYCSGAFVRQSLFEATHWFKINNILLIIVYLFQILVQSRIAEGR